MAEAAAISALMLEFPWLPNELLEVLVDAYVETGDPARAQRAMRAAPAYEQYFPGNRREDGTLRYDEQMYQTYVDRAQIALASVNVNPDLFMGQIVDAIAGGVPITELESRIDSAYERVIDRAPAVREFYATNYGIDMTDSAIVASILDPELGSQIIEGRISTAEIGGEAALRGFGIDLQLADQIRQRGVDAQGAAQVFSQAAEQLPVLDVLAARHGDPDDDFDLNEFLNASIFDDPRERRRIRRLLTQERASFTQGSFARSDSGALTGRLPA